MTGESICKFFEALKLEAYICPAGKPTIGWVYSNGTKLGGLVKRRKCERELFLGFSNA